LASGSRAYTDNARAAASVVSRPLPQPTSSTRLPSSATTAAIVADSTRRRHAAACSYASGLWALTVVPRAPNFCALRRVSSNLERRRCRQAGRHWMRSMFPPAPGLTFVYSALLPGICLLVRDQTVVTIITRRLRRQPRVRADNGPRRRPEGSRPHRSRRDRTAQRRDARARLEGVTRRTRLAR
jgi:hypothetical protein